MPRTYDDEIQQRILERKKRAEQAREEQIRKRNQIFMIGGIALVVLIVLIIIISKIASGGSKKKNEVPTTTPVVETTTQEPTTVEETTPAVLTMYTTDTLNLRQSASTEAEIITQVPSGKAVTVLNNEGEWYQVQYGDKQGYLKAEYLKADESQTTQQAGESGTVAKTTSAVETTSAP